MVLASALVSTGCASLSSSHPDLGEDYSNDLRLKRHVYAGAGFGSSWMNPDTSDATTLKVNERVAKGGQLTLGVDLSRQLAVELHAADLGSAGLSPSGRVEYNIQGGSALLYAGKNRGKYKRSGLSGFGRLGLGYLAGNAIGDFNHVVNNQTHLLLGAGLEYMTRSGLGLRAEAISFDTDVRYMQLGLLYRFGKRNSNKAVEIVKATQPAPSIAPVPVVELAAAKPAPVDKCEEFSGTLHGVNFHSNSDELTDDAMVVLNAVANRLGECDSVPVQISAHTDSDGSRAYNQVLSERRARSVSAYLSEQGIEKSRLTAMAFGESLPIDTNDTAEGKKRNRRVELTTVQ